MNILVFNQRWFADEWREAGHKVVTYGNHASFDLQPHTIIPHVKGVLEMLPRGFEPDLLLFYDNSAPYMIAGLDEIDIPTCFYSVDIHHHHELHRYYAEIFDHMTVAQPDYLAPLREAGLPVSWLPLWAPIALEPRERRHGAVFVGTLDARLNPDRVRFFDELKKRAPIMCMSGDYRNIFPFSDIVVNQTVKGDLNFRVFETMMSGAMLLTERSGNGLLELFRDGEHLLCYEKNNVEEAASMISSGIANISKTREIAANGRREVLSAHTAAHRATTLMSTLRELSHGPRRMRHFSNALNFAVVARRAAPVSPETSANSLVVALRSIELALDGGEEIDTNLSYYLIRACLLFDSVFKSGAGGALLSRMGERFPEEALLSLAYVRSLLNRGAVVQAQEVAQRLRPSDPTGLFAEAERLVVGMLEGD